MGPPLPLRHHSRQIARPASNLGRLGHADVRVWIEPVSAGRNALWVVEISLRAGLPPGSAAIVAMARAVLGWAVLEFRRDG
jgi:hypothetical protein